MFGFIFGLVVAGIIAFCFHKNRQLSFKIFLNIFAGIGLIICTSIIALYIAVIFEAYILPHFSHLKPPTTYPPSMFLWLVIVAVVAIALIVVLLRYGSMKSQWILFLISNLFLLFIIVEFAGSYELSLTQLRNVLPRACLLLNNIHYANDTASHILDKDFCDDAVARHLSPPYIAPKKADNTISTNGNYTRVINNNYHFSFLFDKSFTIDIGTEGAISAERIYSAGNTRTFNSFAIFVEPNTDNVSFTSYINKQAMYLSQNTLPLQIFQAEIAGKQAIVLEDPNNPEIMYYFLQLPHSQAILEVTRLDPNNRTFPEFETILTSFQFN